MPNDIIGDGQPLNDQPDDTGSSTDDALKDIPDESEGLEEKKEEPKEEDSNKKIKSALIQKKKYREKFLQADDKIKQLEEKINLLESKGQTTDDEKKELAAQKYIQDQALKIYQQQKEKEKMEEEKASEVFQEQLDEAVEESGFVESDIVDMCEEFEVEPAVAVKILKKGAETKTKKPKLPTSKRASVNLDEESEDELEKKDKGKTLFQIAHEIKKKLKG